MADSSDPGGSTSKIQGLKEGVVGAARIELATPAV